MVLIFVLLLQSTLQIWPIAESVPLRAQAGKYAEVVGTIHRWEKTLQIGTSKVADDPETWLLVESGKLRGYVQASVMTTVKPSKVVRANTSAQKEHPILDALLNPNAIRSAALGSLASSQPPVGEVTVTRVAFNRYRVEISRIPSLLIKSVFQTTNCVKFASMEAALYDGAESRLIFKDDTVCKISMIHLP